MEDSSMDRIELAERRYRAMMPEPSREHLELVQRELEVWLSSDVCPLVADYARRPRFRDQAAWPLEKLSRGANSPERRLVEAVDRSLVACAKALTKLAAKPSVATAMEAMYPPRERIVRETILITVAKSERLHAERGTIDTLAIETSQMRGIAGRFWTDLVCREEYFEPRGEWMRKSPEGHLQAGEFIVSFNPELLPIGDLISRTLLRRVEVLLGLVEAFRQKCLAAVARAQATAPALLKVVNAAWEQLDADQRSLRSAIQAAPAVQVRESCVILTQAYAAFHPSPDLGWLKLSEALVQHGAATVRFQLCHKRGLEVSERIAAALGDLRQLYAGVRPEQAAIDEAIAAGGLVLVGDSREAYWDGKRIDADWYGQDRSWRLLWGLAKKSGRSSPVSEADLFGNDIVSRSTMSTIFGRLKRLLPSSLWKQIRPGQSARTYHMDLRPRGAYLF